MSDLIQQYVGVLLRTIMVALTAHLVSKQYLTPDQSSTLVDQFMSLTPAIAALTWSAIQKYHAQKMLHTALASAPGTSVDTIKERVANGMGASISVLLLVALTGQACALVTSLKPGPTGYTKDQVKTILTDARWGVSEACDQGWIPADTCPIVLDGLDTGKSAVEGNPAAATASGLKVVQDILNRLPADNKARSYIQYLLNLFKPFVK